MPQQSLVPLHAFPAEFIPSVQGFQLNPKKRGPKVMVINAWNEYLFALTFTSVEQSAKTIPVVIASFTAEFAKQEPFGEILAAATLSTVPLLVLVFIFQKRIIEGLTAGAVKG